MRQLLDADFDPAQWDAVMASAFGDAYYDAHDPEAAVQAGATLVADAAAAWQDSDGDAGVETFAAVHRRVTRREAHELALPDNDYDAAADAGHGSGRSRDSPSTSQENASEVTSQEGDDPAAASAAQSRQKACASARRLCTAGVSAIDARRNADAGLLVGLLATHRAPCQS